MGFMTALARAGGAVEKSGSGVPAFGYVPALGSIPTASGLLVSQATALQVAAVYACVRIRARDLARCTPKLQRDDGTGNKIAVTEHPLVALFKRPNRVQT